MLLAQMVSALSALVFVSESGIVRRQVRVASLGDWAVNYVSFLRLVDIANVVVVLMWMVRCAEGLGPRLRPPSQQLCHSHKARCPTSLPSLPFPLTHTRSAGKS